MFIRTLILLAFSSLFALQAQASVILDVQGGQLYGASGIDVEGSLYDVRFIDGSCLALFSPCASSSDFMFQTRASADAASAALINLVFLDTSLGLFDSLPELTNGCEFLDHCIVLTPFGVGPVSFTSDFMVEVSVARNHYSESIDAAPGINAAIVDWELWNIPGPPITYAVWTRTVEATEPTSLALLTLGLAGIGFSRKKW